MSLFAGKHNLYKQENQNLRLTVHNLTDQLASAKEALLKAQDEQGKIAKSARQLCEHILAEQLAREELNGESALSRMSIHDLIEEAIAALQEHSLAQQEVITNLMRRLTAKEKENKSLQDQLSRLLTKSGIENTEEVLQDEEPEPEPVETPEKPAETYIFEDDDEEPAMGKIDLKNAGSSSSMNTKEKSMAHVVDLQNYMDNMSEAMWIIMYAIGGEGLSEAKAIKERVIRPNLTEAAVNTAITQLRKMNLIVQEKITTGWRWFYAYELSDIGERLFETKFEKEPVLCEKQILKREHTTALHGYCIKDTAHILQNVLGYESATIGRKENTIKLYTGKIYIPDVIAKKGELVDYIEVELGNHMQNDFIEKCDKMHMVTKRLYFVAPDQGTLSQLQRQVSQWVAERGAENLAGTTVSLTTLTKLNEGKWDSIHTL